MDVFTVVVEVANPAGGEFVSLDALAGPDAHFTVLPASLPPTSCPLSASS